MEAILIMLPGSPFSKRMAESCGNKLSNLFTVYLFGHTNFNFGMQTDVALVVSHGSLIHAEERFAFARLAVFFHSEVVRTRCV